ncbi:MAG: dihydrodipicolinate synthase family protein [Spirochaetia bacterium]|jgi:4-hydroxy-tetrahydrodipicolinate synthase
MQTSTLRGVVVPIITPLDAEEKVDEAGLRRLIRRLAEAGVHGLFVGGSAGEGPLLPSDQWQRMTEIAFDEVKGRMPLLGGVMDTSSRRVREKVKALRAIGYSHFVVTQTFYLAARAESEHLRLFGEAREAGGNMEMIAYNIPQCTGTSIAVDTLCEMGRRGWLRHCKESSGDMAYFRDLVRRGGEVGISVLGGDEVTMLEELRAGAAGLVPGCGNIIPAIFIQAFEAAERKDWAGAARIHDEMMRMRAPLVTGGTNWLSGIKYAASLLGSGSGRAMSPLEPVGVQQKQAIEQLLGK